MGSNTGRHGQPGAEKPQAEISESSEGGVQKR